MKRTKAQGAGGHSLGSRRSTTFNRLRPSRHRPTRPRRRVAAAVASTVMAASLVTTVDALPASAAEPTIFDQPGTYTYTVPAGVDQLAVDALGGAGGNRLESAGGVGGRVQAVLAVAGGDVLTVIVGGVGGGDEYYYNDYGYYGQYGYGSGWGGDSGAGYGGQAGGGGSTVRWMYGDRLVVAGGGGGPGLDGACGGHGGGAGTPNGGDGCPGVNSITEGDEGGKGGTATAGGAAGCSTVSHSATGPDGGDGDYYFGSGGGGYYGGGGSCTDNGTYYNFSGGGGGGSSYATPDAIGAPVYSIGQSTNSNLSNPLGHGSVILTPGTVVNSVDLPPPSDYPSGDCKFLGGQQVVDTTAQGVEVYLYTYQVSTEQVHVCWRADSGGTGVGGKLVISTEVPSAGSVGAPSVDGNASACTTTTSPPNQVPGSHPVTSGGVAGVPYSFDAYTDGGSTAWACVQVGSAVTKRVIVPLSVTGPSGDAVVAWYPDEGTA